MLLLKLKARYVPKNENENTYMNFDYSSQEIVQHITKNVPNLYLSLLMIYISNSWNSLNFMALNLLKYVKTFPKKTHRKYVYTKDNDQDTVM